MTCFVETLTLRAWFGHVLSWAKQERRSGKPGIPTCQVVDSSPIAWVIARVTSRWFHIDVKRFVFRLIDVRDENNLLVRLRVPVEDVGVIRDQITNSPQFQEYLKEVGATDRLSFFIAKQVADAHVVHKDRLGRPVFLIQVCRWAAKKTGLGTAVLFIDERPWQKILSDYAEKWGIELRPVRHLDRNRLTRQVMRWIPDSLLTLLNIVRFRSRDFKSMTYVRGLAGWLLSPRKNRTDVSLQPKMGVHYAGQLNLSKPECYSDLFFLHDTPLKPSDVVMCFGLPNAPLTTDTREEFARNGIRVVAQRPEMTTAFDVPIYNFGLPAPAVKSSTDLERMAMEQARADYNAHRDGWQKYFERENIKVYVSWLKQNQIHIAMADAIKATGGVSAMYQRSFEPLPTHELTMHSDIAFNFSPMAADVERRVGSRIRYHVATGYLGDFRFPLLRSFAKEVRARLLNKGAKRIISYFDENSLPDPRWNTGREAEREGYAFFFDKVLQNPDLGLLLKPKVPSTLRARLGPAAELLQAAEKTGRCLLLGDGEMRHSTLPPAAAGLASDLAIQGVLSSGTAGLEIALAGVPTVLVDREGWSVSPLYALGRGKVAFTEWEELWSAIMDHWKKPVPGFGDWGNYLNQMDSFRDGRAAERMAAYLDWMMEAFRNGNDREGAMSVASERYASKWGADKIVEIPDGKIIPYTQPSLHASLA